MGPSLTRQTETHEMLSLLFDDDISLLDVKRKHGVPILQPTADYDLRSAVHMSQCGRRPAKV